MHFQEITIIERAKVTLACVPLPCSDGSGTVPKFHLKVEVAIAVGPQLLLLGNINLFNLVTIG